MSRQNCSRCGQEEHIPTHQFVKYDLEVKYLCGSCWEDFRAFMNARERMVWKNIH